MGIKDYLKQLALSFCVLSCFSAGAMEHAGRPTGVSWRTKIWGAMDKVCLFGASCAATSLPFFAPKHTPPEAQFAAGFLGGLGLFGMGYCALKLGFWTWRKNKRTPAVPSSLPPSSASSGSGSGTVGDEYEKKIEVGFDRQPLGIENLGLSCYRNALTQVLFSAEAMMNWLVTQRTSHSPFFNVFKLCAQHYAVGDKAAFCDANKNFQDILTREGGIVHSWVQYDACQFFERFINTLESAALPLEPDILQGLHTFFKHSTITFLKCDERDAKVCCSFKDVQISNNRFSNNPPCSVLHVAFPEQGASLIPSMDEHFRPEVVEDHRHCSDTRTEVRHAATKTTKIYQSPQYLLIAIKAGEVDKKLIAVQSGKKVKNLKVPFDLPMGNYVARAGSGLMYRLRGLVCHRGLTQDGGHYIALVKRAGVWFYCDDGYVYRVSQAQVEQWLGQGTIIGDNGDIFAPSLLLYEGAANVGNTEETYNSAFDVAGS